MKFGTDNKIVQLCAKGMALEGEGKPGEAYQLFLQAWKEATDDLEKFTAAHYVARHQKDTAGKLQWDQTALAFALKIDDENMKGVYSSLYLNIGKCFEDLEDINNARLNYQLALSFAGNLANDGYGNMIKTGIKKAIERVGH